MNRLQKVLYIVSWIPFAIIKLLLVILGLIVVPVGLALSGGKGNEWAGIFWLWGNDEEWIPEWWMVRANQEWYTKHWPRFWWLAIRNPVGNFRFLFKDKELKDCHIETDWDLNIPMEAKQLNEQQQPSAYMWVWSGPFAGYRKVWLKNFTHYSEIWFGWKLASGVPGLGFTTQVRLKREIGK